MSYIFFFKAKYISRTSQSRIKHGEEASRKEGRDRDPNPSWKLRHIFGWHCLSGGCAERTNNPGSPAGPLCSFQDTCNPVLENYKGLLLLFLILALVHWNSTTLKNLMEVRSPCMLISLESEVAPGTKSRRDSAKARESFRKSHIRLVSFWWITDNWEFIKLESENPSWIFYEGWVIRIPSEVQGSKRPRKSYISICLLKCPWITLLI